jgi:GntR family transcriptional regulator
VRQAVKLGVLSPGDQLPTVKDVVAALAINPNTVLKAYRELELEGLTEGRRGVGTFVREQLDVLPPDEVRQLRSSLQQWVARARAAGLEDDTIAALFADIVRPTTISRVA